MNETAPMCLPRAGGAMSLYAGLKYKSTLGGLICFSGWLPKTLFEKELSSLPSVPHTKVLMVHGLYDSKVLFDRGTAARDLLAAKGATVEFHRFDGDHELFPPALDFVQKFIAGAS